MRRLLAALLVHVPVAAAQEGFDAHGFDQTVSDSDLHDLLQTWRPEAQKAGTFGISLLGERSDRNLVLFEDPGAGPVVETILLDDLYALNLGVHAGVHKRIGVAVGMPVWLSSVGRTGTSGAGIGDVALNVPVGILLPEADRGFALSVVPGLKIPSGPPSRFLGDQNLGGNLIVAPGIGFGAFQLQSNVGLELGRRAPFLNLREGGRFVAGLGATLALGSKHAVGLEADYRSSLSKNAVPGTGSPGEVVLHFKGRYPMGLSWTVGGATAMTPGESAAVWRAFLGLGMTIGKDGPRDFDRDGFIGAADQCEREPETVNGWKDDDGCPDGLATYALAVFDPEGQPLAGATILRPDGTEVGSTDSFGRIVVRDLMPGTTLAVRAEHGAGLYVPGEHESPELVEGEQSGTLRLLWRPGTIRVITRNEDGAPVDSSLKFEGPETRADQLLGSDGTETFVLPPGTWTIFATAPQFGTERREVVLSANENALTVIEFGLRRAVTAVTESGVAILEPVLFEFNSDVLKPESQRLIEQVANTIRITPEIRHLEVQGHTSTEGSDAHNRGLSQRRVDAVVRYLVSHGVERSRLTAIGYGESCTAVREATEADREKNRRVQFYILEPEPPNGIPCHAGVPGQLDSQRFEYQRQRRQ